MHVELPTDAVSIIKTESRSGDSTSTEPAREDTEQQDGMYRYTVENEL